MPQRKYKDARTPSQALEMPQRELTVQVQTFWSVSQLIDHEVLSHCHAITTDYIPLLETKVLCGKKRGSRPQSLGTDQQLQFYKDTSIFFKCPLHNVIY